LLKVGFDHCFITHPPLYGSATAMKYAASSALIDDGGNKRLDRSEADPVAPTSKV
jgi:hypothetical protein